MRGGRGAGAAGARVSGPLPVAVTVAAVALTAEPGPAQAPMPVSPDGASRIAFPLRDDVELCPEGSGRVLGTRGDVRIRLRGEGECDRGEAIAVVEMEGGRLRALRLRSGAPETGADAARLSGPEAARTFLALARDARRGEAGSDAVVAAVVARDAVVWPGLLDLARSEAVAPETRTSAVFWVGQRAAEAAPDLGYLARADHEDREVRKAAVFALSRLDGGAGRNALIEVARSDTDPEVRRAAFFWLAEGADDEVLAFFEAILGGGG